MASIKAEVAMVEVITADGHKELWAVASTDDEAVAIVEKLVAAGSTVRLTDQRLPHSPKMDGFGIKEVRRVRPWP